MQANATVFGAAGNALGLHLLKMSPCANPDCSDAVRLCASTPRCDTMELRLSAKGPTSRRRRRNGTPINPTPSLAILRASWQNWGSRDPSLSAEVGYCKLLARQARDVLPGQWLAKQRRLLWQQRYCDEYVSAEGDPLPDFGRDLQPSETQPKAGLGPVCPPSGTKLFIVTYQNGPSPWLCTFLRTLGYRGVHVVVLGWQPKAFVRANNVFYFTDRVYTLLRYLLSCQASLAADASIMFCDSDELYQLHGGLEQLAERTEALYSSTSASVIISAEARCMPNRLGPLAWEHSEGIAHMAKKWPRCLNTGNFVGRIGPTIEMLNQTCIPCRSGLHVGEVFKRYTRAYSYQVRSWIYSEQAELMRLYLARPANVSGWVLDFEQKLFHPCFWFTANWDTRVLPDGRIRNRHTGSTPAFMHYNGDSKHTWKGSFSPRSLARALRESYLLRTRDNDLTQLGGYLRDGVHFLGPTFERDQHVSWQDVCSQGSIEGEDGIRQ